MVYVKAYSLVGLKPKNNSNNSIHQIGIHYLCNIYVQYIAYTKSSREAFQTQYITIFFIPTNHTWKI